MAITKRELARRIAIQTGVKQEVSRQIIQSFLDEVIGELEAGNRLEFRDFGVFDVVVKAPRVARNPRTGESVQIPEKRVVHFKAGRLMKERVLKSSEGAAQSTPSSQSGGAPTEV